MESHHLPRTEVIEGHVNALGKCLLGVAGFHRTYVIQTVCRAIEGRISLVEVEHSLVFAITTTW